MEITVRFSSFSGVDDAADWTKTFLVNSKRANKFFYVKSEKKSDGHDYVEREFYIYHTKNAAYKYWASHRDCKKEKISPNVYGNNTIQDCLNVVNRNRFSALSIATAEEFITHLANEENPREINAAEELGIVKRIASNLYQRLRDCGLADYSRTI